MKTKRFKITILLMLLLVSVKSRAQTPELHISIDHRIETIYTIAFLNDYFLVNHHESLHKSKLKDLLQPLKNHRAVALFDTLSKEQGFQFNKVTDWVLQFDQFPELTKVRTLANPYPFVEKEQGDLMENFREACIAFYQEPLFQRYLKEVKTWNDAVIAQVKQSETIRYLPAYLETYYGKTLGAYHLILSPLVHSGGFNSEFVAHGTKEVYAVIGPNGEIEYLPYFEKSFLEMDLILHEFGHSFVNPLGSAFQAEVASIKDIYFTETLKKQAERQGYSGWETIFNELVIRAVTIRLTQMHFGQAKAQELLDYERSVGFALVEPILALLEDYENNREKYPSFSAYYPVLIERL